MLWTVAEINNIFSSSITEDIHRVVIDSRVVQSGDLFVAIKGDIYDGNDFAIDAIKKGAACCIIDREIVDIPDGKKIICRDGLEALRSLAGAARSRSAGKMIAVTGSAGKTSTKEMLRLVFSSLGKVHASTGNLNNHFGLPLSMANMPMDAEFGIFELGMSAAGEIRNLSMLLKPDISLITLIAPAHLAFFDSVKEIALAKAEIFEGTDSNGYAVINMSSPYSDVLCAEAMKHNLKILRSGVGFDGCIKDLILSEDSSIVEADIKGEKIKYTIGLPGMHQAANSILVLLTVSASGYDVSKAASALQNFNGASGRGRLIVTKSGLVKLLDDSYNANPASVSSAIQTLGSFHSEGKKIAILGDMLELGASSAVLHAEIADVIRANAVDEVHCVGSEMLHLWKALDEGSRGEYARDSLQMLQMLRDIDISGQDVVLVKGSRSMKMEILVEWIEKNR